MQNDKRKPRKITIERIRVTTIRASKSGQKFFCNVCGSEVDTVAIPGDARHMNACVIDVGTVVPEEDETNETKKTGE
jgi:hypothetical protein